MPAAHFRLAAALFPLLASPWLTAQQLAGTEAADRALLAGDCKGAVEGYLEAGKADRDPRVTERAVEVARACRHLPAASQAADRLLELDAENVEALRLVGLVALETWRLDLARRVYGELLAKPDVEPERALGDLLPEIADSDATAAAWQVLKDIVDRGTASPRILMQLARIACDAEDAAACLALIDMARARDGGNDARSIRLAAAAAATRGDVERALNEADLVARGDPENYRFARIETLIALDRLDEAREALLAIEADTTVAEGRAAIDADRRLALLALSLGDEAEAERRFGVRLSRERGSAEALYYLSIIAERRGRKDVALQGYRQLIGAGAGLPPRARAARILLERGERDEALKLFDDLMKNRRVDAIEVQIARSRALFDSGSLDEALASLDAALEKYPAHPDLLYHRAVLLDNGGRTREGLRQFEALIAARPNDANVMNALGYTLADRRRQLARAEKLIRDALAQRPDNAAFLDSLGWVRFRRGDSAGALAPLEQAWRLSREPEIAAHWGEVLWVSGNRAQARAVWARALLIAPDSRPLRATLERLTGSSTPVEPAKP